MQNGTEIGEDGRDRQRGHGGARVLVEDSHVVVGDFRREERAVQENGVHAPEAHRRGNRGRAVVELQVQSHRVIVGDGIVVGGGVGLWSRHIIIIIISSSCCISIIVRLWECRVRLFFMLLVLQRHSNDSFDCVVDGDKGAAREELTEHRGRDSRQRTVQPGHMREQKPNHTRGRGR